MPKKKQEYVAEYQIWHNPRDVRHRTWRSDTYVNFEAESTEQARRIYKSGELQREAKSALQDRVKLGRLLKVIDSGKGKRWV